MYYYVSISICVFKILLCVNNTNLLLRESLPLPICNDNCKIKAVSNI